jgi:phosphoglycolate phosphatase-like HAD superfamily hydrolase
MARMVICLFDIDGTLLSSGGAGKAAMETALTEEFGLGALQGRVSYSGRTDRAIGLDLFRLHGIEASPANWRRFLDAYLGLLPSCLAAHRGQVLPGIAALLEHLAGRDHFAVGLLTGNLREGARLKLGHYGLYHHFAFGGFGDHHLDRDDVARDALAAACEHLDGTVRPERVWVIGDTPLDVRCARAIGARAAAVATGWHSHEELAAAEPDLLLTDLSDPQPLLSLWS